MKIVQPQHPITRGMHDFQADDELYICLAGNLPVEMLATVRSKVTHKDEPMAFVFPYGKGRVFHSPLGHDVKAFEMPGVATLYTALASGRRVNSPSWFLGLTHKTMFVEVGETIVLLDFRPLCLNTVAASNRHMLMPPEDRAWRRVSRAERIGSAPSPAARPPCLLAIDPRMPRFLHQALEALGRAPKNSCFLESHFRLLIEVEAVRWHVMCLSLD